MTTNTQPTAPSHPLKGILNTNDDPFRCAVCSKSIDCGSDSFIYCCCGGMVCKQCGQKGLNFHSITGACRFCNVQLARGTTKKQAKRGHPWAQHAMGALYNSGDTVTASHYEAVRWFRKAAAGGHPDAMLCLSAKSRLGEGCARDLVEAKSWAEKALALVSACCCSAGGNRIKATAYNELTNIGMEYSLLDEDEVALSIVSNVITAKWPRWPETEDRLGAVYFNAGKFYEALSWFEKCTLQGNYGAKDRCDASQVALDCCFELNRLAEAKFWMDLASSLADGQELVQSNDLSDVQEQLRTLRKSCKVCSAPLSTATRKLCKACKTYCYCSVECQKIHWNRSKDGHREECKRVTELGEQLAKAVREDEK